MRKIDELFPFDKFWMAFERQSRSCSSWDENRTDMAVFIDRTMSKWVTGKFFQIEYEESEKKFLKPVLRRRYTKYVLITHVRFSYGYENMITFSYIEPHSKKEKEIRMGYGDFKSILLEENEADFRILHKFYPIKKSLKLRSETSSA